MKTTLLTLGVLSSFLLISFLPTETLNQKTSASETSTLKLEYPDNQSKSFIEEDEFYSKLDKNIYEEYKDAAFSMRKKVSFKEVADTELTFKLKTKLGSEKMDNLNSPHIHPNRQVYFMGSFHQNEKEEWHKFVVIDAETQKVLLGGDHYHLYDNPYSNRSRTDLPVGLDPKRGVLIDTSTSLFILKIHFNSINHNGINLVEL
ncbi:hypothetical protein [Lysinibacillus sp. BPa_S21]|uniref:hypothetical protein n=1 Tax=Lysinibacillus sp. BPa_S21 TaxID=2932478 RepID=UPI0020110630|nr:hypothetical protein [Lysinibacillus sp. BPa_S21]MCL1696769.1 hypothetical protein [Lysinibacillus sp. BPa_S21]